MRVRLPSPHIWPTIWCDLLSCLHLVVVWSFFVFDYKSNFKRRDWSALFETWEDHDYLAEVQNSVYDKFLFGVWTFQVIVTVWVVHFHLTVAHHPKFYVGTMNKISILAHIVGGTVADFGSYFGFVLGNKTLLQVSSLAGLLLHGPSFSGKVVISMDVEKLW